MLFFDGCDLEAWLEWEGVGDGGGTDNGDVKEVFGAVDFAESSDTDEGS